MIVLHKRWLIISACSLILLTTVILSILFFSSSGHEEKQIIAKSNVMLPTIIIDAGHGGEDSGAIASDGTLEKDINLEISLNLRSLFETAGYEVVMTRDGDYSIYDNPTENNTIRLKKVSDMRKRLQIYNSKPANVVISIHQNKFAEGKYSGSQVFYSPNNRESSLLADSITASIKGMLTDNNTRDSKSANKNIYLLWNSTSPAVIVECGFLSNQNELERLKSDEYRKKIAFSIFCGFLDYSNTNANQTTFADLY
ncbi:N-acetylmuramoyl-L-alanine amidase CwlD [Clostridia bacterium]|nr:N-acetylmuramoyl-L-alanine amidase CwlD [Clostridia bacterium]